MSENIIYKKCCVYKISSKVNPEMIYYGSTNNFYKRMTDHKSDYKRYLNNEYCYLTVFDIFDLGDSKQEIVKFYNDISKKQLRDFETEFIQNNKCVNKAQSMTDEMKKEKIKESNKEWYERNKDYHKERYENNKEKINKQIICDICKGNYTTANKARHIKNFQHQQAIRNQIEELSNKINNIQPKIKIKMKQTFNIDNSKDITINTAIDKEAADNENNN